MGAQKLPEELPVKVGLRDIGSGAGRRGLFCLTQGHKAKAGALTQYHGAQQGSPNHVPGRGALVGSRGRSREASPELTPQLGHGPEEVGAVAAIRVPAGRESRWRAHSPAALQLNMNQASPEPSPLESGTSLLPG